MFITNFGYSLQGYIHFGGDDEKSESERQEEQNVKNEGKQGV
jgi:hypothetical protein